METHRDESFWEMINRKWHTFREDLRVDSVAGNPRKPVDCCNPPVPDKDKRKKSE
jgi:hypothetical protein